MAFEFFRRFFQKYNEKAEFKVVNITNSHPLFSEEITRFVKK